MRLRLHRHQTNSDHTASAISFIRTHLRLTLLAFTLLVLPAAGLPAAATAATPAPAWSILSVAEPTSFIPGDPSKEDYRVYITNTGSQPTDGSTVTITDTLPTAVAPVQVSGEDYRAPNNPPNCTQSPPVQCTVSGVVSAGDVIEIDIPITIAASASGVATNVVSVTGGGATDASSSTQTPFSSTPAPFGINDFSFAVTGVDGQPDTQAGHHPYAVSTTLDFNTEEIPGSGHRSSPSIVNPSQNVKDIVTDLPLGFVGNPQAAPKCPLYDLQEGSFGQFKCPADTVIGEVTLRSVLSLGSESSVAGTFSSVPVSPLYNLVPEAGHPAEFGFAIGGVTNVYLYPSVVHTSSGYVLRVTSPNAPSQYVHPGQTGFLSGVTLTLFGDPEAIDGTGNAPAPFYTNPTDCSANGFTATVHVDTWEHPGQVNADRPPDFSDPNWLSASASLPPVTGCNLLHFNPSLTLQPDTTSADSPTGLNVDLHVPQNADPNGLATPPLRDATVTLPKGLAVNPSSADGLEGCTPGQIAIETNDPGGCPQASQIGKIEIKTPLLDHPLPGKVYLGTPECAPCSDADAAAGKLVKLFIEVHDPVSGVIVKLPGSGALDSTTGQITASFKENPQLPFEDLDLTFKGGPRATLTTPPTCGHYTTTTDLKPWSAPQSGPDATPQSSFDLSSGPNGSPCVSSEAALANSPSFEAGTTTPIAGSYSPFVLKLSREDGSQRVSAIDTTLPQGLLGRLAGIPYCSDAAIAAAANKSGNAELASPNCPLASQVGIVNIGAGSGTPFYVQGHAYLAGPYKGAPLSLAIVTPAVAGPFDLGTVVVRTALYVNETTAQIHAVSDPIPSILAGIPLDVRSIALNMDKPKFILNPTSCNAMAVLGGATTIPGQTANLSERFQVGACGALGFKPSVALSLKGATKRNQHPALKAVVTYPKKGAYANIAKAAVTLPASEFIDNARIGDVCTRPQFAAGKCPPSSVLGKARAFTPLLDKPLEGPVYFRSNGGERELPDIVADLNGQIHLVLVGAVDAVHKKGSEVSRIRNTFAQVPDAPVSKFVLELKGGKKGLLVNSGNLCKVPNKAVVKLTAQNGKTYDTHPPVANSCGKKSKHKKHKSRHRAAT